MEKIRVCQLTKDAQFEGFLLVRGADKAECGALRQALGGYARSLAD